MTNEWVEWHRGYEGPGPRTRRLRVVQKRIREALEGPPPGPVQIISICAGDGRDVLGVLVGHPRAGDVRARLVELTPELATLGREQALRYGLPGVEFVRGDASITSAYAGAVPADIVLVCGVFGNISDLDVRGTIDHLPELCAPNATVIWTRGRFAPDLTPTIRGWFRDAGFTDLSFTPIRGTTLSVGANRLGVPPPPFRTAVRLFTFLPKGKRPSDRRRGASPERTTTTPPDTSRSRHRGTD